MKRRASQCAVVVAIVALLALPALLAEPDSPEAKRVAVATRAVPAFTVVTTDDLKIKEHSVTSGADVVKTPKQADGKVVLAAVSEGDTIATADVIDADFVRGLVPLELSVMASPGHPAGGELATVVLSPRVADVDGIVLHDVHVLKRKDAKTTTTLILGLSAANAEQLGSVLGVSDVRVVPTELPLTATSTTPAVKQGQRR